MKAIQLSIWGLSDDESVFSSTLWGTVKFFPSKDNSFKNTCQKCILYDNAAGRCTESNNAHCADYERADRREGYFSIHEMPNNR